MPAYRVRSKRGTRRATLTIEEEIELTVGPPPDHPSLFASPGDRADAAALFAIIDAGRSRLEALLAGGAPLRELRRRHERHFAYDDDPRYPATFNATGCAECNPGGWHLPAQGGMA